MVVTPAVGSTKPTRIPGSIRPCNNQFMELGERLQLQMQWHHPEQRSLVRDLLSNPDR